MLSVCFCAEETLREAAKYTDLFLYDYKLTDDALHQKLCGASNRIILSNLKLLHALGAEVILRCPIIPGQNDDAAHIHGIATVAAAHSCITQVHLEPYHRLGIDKARRLGMEGILDAAPPEKEIMEQYRHTIQEACGKPVWISS